MKVGCFEWHVFFFHMEIYYLHGFQILSGTTNLYIENIVNLYKKRQIIGNIYGHNKTRFVGQQNEYVGRSANNPNFMNSH